MKQNLIELEGKVDISAIVFGNFNTILVIEELEFDRTIRKK